MILFMTDGLDGSGREDLLGDILTMQVFSFPRWIVLCMVCARWCVQGP